MNPFELQAQFARQWFGLVQSMTTAAMTTYATMGEQAATAWSQALPTTPAAPSSNPFFAWAWPSAAPLAAPWTVSTPFSSNPWQANPFAAWMSMFTPKPAAFPMFPGLPFAPAMAQFWAPWTATPTATAAPWMAPFSAPARNPGSEILEQLATNYRTASGYAVAAVVGPLNAALDPRTYGEPWWQKLDQNRKPN